MVVGGLKVCPMAFNLFYGCGKQLVTRRTYLRYILQIECMTPFIYYVPRTRGYKVSTS